MLRSIQRYGRLGRRSGNVPEEALESRDKIKEAKYIYLSIDEAGTHVGVRCFRYASSPMLSPCYPMLTPTSPTMQPICCMLAYNPSKSMHPLHSGKGAVHGGRRADFDRSVRS